jgi:hypothetical protein
VLLDIDGAFDNTSFGSMDAASGEHGFVLTLRKWIDAMLCRQIVRVEIRGTRVRVLVDWGCLQGGVLSPLLWSMVVDFLLCRLHNAHYQALMMWFCCKKFVSALCDRMHGALNCVENWCREIGLYVNADKTKMVLFRKIGGFYNPRLFGTELRMTEQVKYLEMILDMKLGWKTHLENRIRKACIAYWQFRRAVGKTWGLSPKVVAWLYTFVVRPPLHLYIKQEARQTANRLLRLYS